MRNVWNAANTHVSRDAYQEKKRMKVLSMGVRDEVTKLYSISGAQKHQICWLPLSTPQNIDREYKK